MDTVSSAEPSREAGPHTERTETWHVDDEGLLIVAVTARRSAIEATTFVAAYRRP